MTKRTQAAADRLDRVVIAAVVVAVCAVVVVVVAVAVATVVVVATAGAPQHCWVSCQSGQHACTYTILWTAFSFDAKTEVPTYTQTCSTGSQMRICAILYYNKMLLFGV